MLKVGVIQDAPCFFDKEKTLEKIEFLVAEYADHQCQLLVFPESFIPGYPRGFNFGAVIGNRSDEGRELYATYYKNAFDLKSKDLKRVEKLSKDFNVFLAIGVTEKQQVHGSLYCSLLYISPQKGLLGVHRKIKPTGTERLIWAEADGASLVSFDTKIGRLGGLICWENYMPLARMSMYRKGIQIYLAPTADARPEWQATIKHIALEGRCFVVSANQYFTKSMLPEPYSNFLKDEAEVLCSGGSVIVSPLGKVLAGPLLGGSGIITAEIDLEDIIKAKLDFDPIAHYSRPDIFQFKVMNQPPTKKE